MSIRSEARRAKDAFSGVAGLGPNTPEYRQMLSVLRQFRVVIASIKEHYREIESKTGVSGAQLWALHAIASRPGINVGQLAHELGIHQSTASNLVVRLIELGHIERKRDDRDMRIVSLKLTRLGKSAVRNAPKPAIGMLQQALLSLPNERLTSLHSNLDELIKSIGLKQSIGAATPLSTSLGRSKR